MSSPYVVTLAVDDDAQAGWDEERARWFPHARTQVGAHVTLFHAVPADLDVVPALTLAADRDAFAVRVNEVVPLGRGVAYRLDSDDLAAVHDVLRRAWFEHLTAQDRQGFRPHVTVQNKVDPDVARATRLQLASDLLPYDVGALGLDLWRYDGGPWTHLRRFDFRS